MKRLFALMIVAVFLASVVVSAQMTGEEVRLEAKRNAYEAAALRHLVKMDAALEAAKDLDTEKMQAARDAFAAEKDKIATATEDDFVMIRDTLKAAAKDFREAAKGLDLTKEDVKDEMDAAVEEHKAEIEEVKAKHKELRIKALSNQFDKLILQVERFLEKETERNAEADLTELEATVEDLKSYKDEFVAAIEADDMDAAKEAKKDFKNAWLEAKKAYKNFRSAKLKKMQKENPKAFRKAKAAEKQWRKKQTMKRLGRSSDDMEDDSDDMEDDSDDMDDDSEEDEEESADMDDDSDDSGNGNGQGGQE